MRRPTRIVALLGAVFVSVGLLAGTAVGQSNTTTSGSSGSATTGVTKDSVTISVSAPFSGVYGIIGKQAYGAAELWQNEVNSAGGINGRKVKLVQVDNQFTPEGAVSACKEVQTNGSFLDVNQIDSGDQIGCEDKAGVPVFASNSGLSAKAIKSYKNVVIGRASPVYPPVEVSFLGSKYVNAKGKKIGIVMGSGPAYTAWYNGLRAELKKQGYDVVHVERTSPDGNQTSFVSEMQRMQQAGAEVVMLEVAFEGAGIIRDAKALGYTPQYYLGPLTATEIFSQASGGAFSGTKALRWVTTVDTPAFEAYVKTVTDAVGADAAKTQATTTTASTYAFLNTLGAAIKAAGPNLTRDSFLTAAKSMENYDELHLIGPFTTKGETLPIGDRAMFPAQCCSADNSFESLGAPAQTFPAAKKSSSSK